MFEIKYLNKNTNEIIIEQLIATKESTAKQWAKQFILHHNEYTIVSIKKI